MYICTGDFAQRPTSLLPTKRFPEDTPCRAQILVLTQACTFLQHTVRKCLRQVPTSRRCKYSWSRPSSPRAT